MGVKLGIMDQEWQSDRSRSETGIGLNVGSHLRCRFLRSHVAQMSLATFQRESCKGRGMGRTASFVTDCNRSFEASVRYPPDRCGQWADALADCGCTDRLIW